MIATPAPRLPPAPLSRVRVGLLATLFFAFAVEGVVESLLLPRRLWGSHFYALYPGWVLVTALIALALAVPASLALGRLEVAAPARDRRPWLPVAVALVAGAVFWLVRARHVFWGDGLPLTVNIPQGQRFHPDEPLAIYAHHLAYRLGGERGPAAAPLGIESVLAGMVFTGWAVAWLRHRMPALWPLATAVLLTQGFAQLFFGYVENYTWLAVCLLVAVTTGVDAIEGRRSVAWPLGAGLLAYAFHIWGIVALGVGVVPVVYGLVHRDRRAATLVAAVAVAVVGILAGVVAAPLYGPESPFATVVAGVLKIAANPTDSRPENLLSLRHLGDVWSTLMLIGPLSVPLVVLLLAALGGLAFARTWKGVFLLGGCFAYFAPLLLAGSGNLGAARNWDLFAAPAVIPAVCGLVLLAEWLPVRQARVALGVLLALSLFHSAPWIASNASLSTSIERVTLLPLGGGRGESLLGTHYLNSGDLAQAESWFRSAVAKSPLEVNSQSGLGLALARQGRAREALGPMRAAVALKPATAQLRKDLALLELRLGEHAAAARTLEALLALAPGERGAWLALARCHDQLGHPDSASMALGAALRRFPGDDEISRALANAYVRRVASHASRGEWAEAARALERFQAAFPGEPRAAELRAALARTRPK